MTQHDYSSHAEISQHLFIVLCSAEHYRWLILESFDFSMLDDTETEAFIEKTTPSHFPCIPRYGDTDSCYPTDYITVDLIKFWAERLEHFGGEQKS